ncbi:hypothetical protein J7E94_18800 [Streptomyces sp. ISL-94]|nr:hypothetical protein [Streptomyces sp. ISL-94]
MTSCGAVLRGTGGRARPRGAPLGGELGAFGVGEGERAAGPAEDEVPGAGGEEAQGGAGGGAADGVEEDGGAAGEWARTASAQPGAV